MKKIILIALTLSSSSLFASDNKSVDANTGQTNSGIFKAKALKVLHSSTNQTPLIFSDKQGNAIVFSNIVVRQKNRQSKSIQRKNKNKKVQLAYSVYDSLQKKWQTQKFVPVLNIENSVQYDFRNSYSKHRQILFVTRKAKRSVITSKAKLSVGVSAKTVRRGDSLWSIRKQGLTGPWGKPQSILTAVKGSLPVIYRSCNNSSCVVAWRSKNSMKVTSKSYGGIYFKTLAMVNNKDVAWGKTLMVTTPDHHQLLQFKVVLLDSSNLALVWLAAVKSKSGAKKLDLKIFVRMRINDKWQTIRSVATLGLKGIVKGLGEFKVAANTLRQIIISWNEQLETAGLRAVYYNKKWFPVVNLYKDNPDVSHLSVNISNLGSVVIFWQQKYGKNTHIFYSRFNASNNNWSVPYKLDKNPNIAKLKYVVRNWNNELAVFGLKTLILFRSHY